MMESIKSSTRWNHRKIGGTGPEELMTGSKAVVYELVKGTYEDGENANEQVPPERRRRADGARVGFPLAGAVS